MTSAHARGTLEEFVSFCSELVTENGSKLELYPEQKLMLSDYFDGVRETLVLVGKKNGKSTLLSALSLYHLLTTPDAECVIAAASRDQAGIILRQARGFIGRSPSLSGVMRVKLREIESLIDNGRVRVLASDVDTADGVIVTLALVDELHRHRSPDLYGVLRDGLGPRDGQMVTISTAGDSEESPLGLLRAAAYAAPGMKRDGAYRYVTTGDFAMHEWALEPDDDRDDLNLVKLANPAPWQTVETLRERHDSPSMTPWQWARFACGVWLAGEDGAFSGKEWDACADPTAAIPANTKGVYVGIDLAWKWDTAAFVPVWREGDSDPFTVAKPTILRPPGDGTSIDDTEHWAVVKEMAAIWPEVTFVIDPNAGGESLAQRIDAELPARVVVHAQQPQQMALAAQRLSEAISGGRIRHPDDPDLNAQILAAAPRPVGEGWRLVKRKKNALPIDASIALAMAVSVIQGTDDTPNYGRGSW